MKRTDFLKLSLVAPLLAACAKVPQPEPPEPAMHELPIGGDGGVLYVEGGTLKWRGPNGTVTTLGVA